VIAIARAQHDPATKEYLARKQAEGHTTKGALRCLKRHLARRIHRLLAEPPDDQQPTVNGKPITTPQPTAINSTPPKIPPPPPSRRPIDPNIAGVAPFAMPCSR
jgi:hypothetical protein